MSKTKLWRVSYKAQHEKVARRNSTEKWYTIELAKIIVTVKPDNGSRGMLFRTITPKAAARAFIRGNLYNHKCIPLSKRKRRAIPVEIRIQK